MRESDITDPVRDMERIYRAEIRSLAKEYLRQPKDTREDWLHETIDGHEWVIYTFKAQCVLVATDHPDAYEEQYGDKPETMEAAAYGAIIYDIRKMADAFYEREGLAEVSP
jgi:hypothetical protein